MTDSWATPVERIGLPWVGVLLVGALCAAQHLLLTVDVSGSLLRVGAADLVLPALILFLAVVCLKARALPRRWRMPGVLLWFVAMTVWLGFSVWRGAAVADVARTWALLKFAGFGVLAAYFTVGGVLTGIWGERVQGLASRAFVLAGWVVSLYSLSRFTLAFYRVLPVEWFPRSVGLAENPNTYALLTGCALCIQAVCFRERRVVGPGVDLFGMVLLLVELVLSSSRSVYLGVALALAALFLMRKLRLGALLKAGSLAGTVLLMIFVLLPMVVDRTADRGAETADGSPRESTDRAPGVERDVRSSGEKPASGYQLPSPERTVRLPGAKLFVLERSYVDRGIAARLRINRDAVRMWMEHPIAGAGVGGYYREQRRLHPGEAYVNHSTLMWWASEMGLVGVLIFGGFAGCLLWSLCRRSKNDDFAAGVLGVALVIVGASLGVDTMYQRYAWFFVGLAVAIPRQWAPRGM